MEADLGTPRLLIVEDDLDVCEMLRIYFSAQNYHVDTTRHGADALEKTRQNLPHLIILDIMLPGMDGFEVCRILRQEMTTPILMLTARDDEIDRVVGLEVGADDYLVKPFSMRELMARIKAMLRRVRLLREEMIIHQPLYLTDDKMKFGDLEIDLLRHEVMIQGRPIALKPKEYEVVVYLARHQGQALRRESILQEVWGWDYVGDSRTVDVHIRWLREKIEADPTVPSRIVTVRGAGYRFEG